LHWHRTLTYKYGASAADGLDLRPNNLLFLGCHPLGLREWLCTVRIWARRPCQYWTAAFKSGWELKKAPLAYSALSAEPSRAVTDKLMPIMQTVIRNSPLWVCRAMGELLYKRLGA